MARIYEKVVAHYAKHNATINGVDSGGQIRASRGTNVEEMIDIVCESLGIESRKGSKDKKTIRVHDIDGKEYTIQHQVDRHLYYENKLIAIVECKAYLDSCYYVRACSDFTRMKIMFPDIKAFVFALEDSISTESRVFTDVETRYACDGIFYMCAGKRSSSKPIYKSEFCKLILDERLDVFVARLRTLLG